MTRMSVKRSATALVMTAALAVPGAATAGTPNDGFVPDGPDAGVYCGKDYSQNSVTGDYCVRLNATVAPAAQGGAKDAGAWSGDERTCVIAALALLIAAAGGTAFLRRRTARSTSGSHTATVTS
jgi:hypothetical protein